MVAVAHFIAITAYIAAAALAAMPLARPVRAPLGPVLAVLGFGIAAHAAGLIVAARTLGYLPVVGLGPALSFAGFVLAVSLFVVEVLAHDVTLILVAAPVAALATTLANIMGLTPVGIAAHAGVWLVSHIALSFVGMAAFATAAAAGAVYLVERRELKSHRFAAVLRAFPPLETLDRVNHAAALTSWLALTLGIVLAASYSVAYRAVNLPQIVWGIAAWLAVSTLAGGRVIWGWRARRAAIVTSFAFLVIVVLYFAVRLAGSASGRFL
jgi:ABC-type uncharacterized transport system permease subunit